jgi:hypothetical protein
MDPIDQHDADARDHDRRWLPTKTKPLEQCFLGAGLWKVQVEKSPLSTYLVFSFGFP